MSEAGGAPPAPPPAGPQPAGNPWERRAELGFAKAFLDSVKLFATAPADAFAQTRRGGDFVSPLIFAVLIGWLGVILAQVWNMIFGVGMMGMMPGGLRDSVGVVAGSGAGVLVGLLLAPIFVVIGLFIGSGILHLCLMLVGALGPSDTGFEGTFRATAYAGVANLGQVVPFVGGLLCLVWWIVLLVVGFTEMHRTTQGKALAAALIPLALCCVCAIIGAVVFGAGLAAMLAGQG